MTYTGLTHDEAKKRLHTYGYNRIEEQKRRQLWTIVREQIKGNFMVYFMIFAAMLSFAVDKAVTGYSIVGVVLVIILVGFIQEYKAEKAVSALKHMLASFSTVLRDGQEFQISSYELVPGDIIFLETGEKIPADCVIVESKDILVNESILTGESIDIAKKPISTFSEPYEAASLLFMGTYILNGHCVAQVIHTGIHTEFGKIAGMISTAEKELPLQGKVNSLVRFMATIAIVVSLCSAVIMLFNLEIWSTASIVDILLISIALMISAFPEGLPVVLISTLAGGAYKMAKKKAIVNRMSIIETLGETTVICSDKTGTITKGEMTTKELFTYDRTLDITGIGYDTSGLFLEDGKDIDPHKDPVLLQLLQTVVLCNNAHLINHAHGQKFKGTPTEIALLVLGYKAHIVEDMVGAQRIEEVLFTSARKMMSVVVAHNGQHMLYSKGAPEIFLQHCTHVQLGDSIVPLTATELTHIHQQITALSIKKYRVLCIGYRHLHKNHRGVLEEHIIFLGGVGLEDSPREGVREAIQSCYDAGIKVKMITGDHKDTAVAIATEIGIVGDVITGEELDALSDADLQQRMPSIVVFARVTPHHKIRIVKALKDLGEIVTMTGDGVNDAPALKEAHIGVAMGINGTDVSREAADLILEDDNFVTIVAAIEEGRIIFKNIQKFVVYQLSCNIAELALIFFAVLIGLPAPLIAIQILFMNLVTDNLPALTLGFTAGSGYIMQRKARKTSDILNFQKKLLLVAVGLFMAGVCLLVYYVALTFFHWSLAAAQTLALLTLIMFEINNAFNFRSLSVSFFRTSFRRNKMLIYASIISLLATVAIIYIPALQGIFATHPLPRHVWIVAFCISFSVIFVVDIAKSITKTSFEDHGNV